MQSTPRQRQPRGKRQRFAEALQRFGLTGSLAPLHDRGRRPLTVLGYHRVRELDARGSQPLDPDLVSATPTEFEWQMRYLRESCTMVSLERVIEHLDGGTPLPARAVAVTFDDGFTDTYHTAFPILRAHRIPAAVFVTTDYLGSGDVFWFERIAQIVMTVPPGWLQFEGTRLPPADDAALRHDALRAALTRLKALPRGARAAIVAEWTARHPRPELLSPNDECRSINWDQLRELAAGGLTIGSHTVTHPNLALLTEADQLQELDQSRRELEQALQREIRTVAYPIGTALAFNATVAASAAKAGYRLGLTYLNGPNWQRSMEPLALRRVSVAPNITREWFAAMVSLPTWCAY